MRRLNETQVGFIESLERLRKKCYNSNFNMKMVKDILDKAKTWVIRFKPDNTQNYVSKSTFNTQSLIYATSFPKPLALTKKEKELNPLSKIIYKKPATLRDVLTNYKNISLNLQPSSSGHGLSSPCGHCALCGNHGKHKNMVATTSVISTNFGSNFILKQNLNCTNFGIYAAHCNICFEFYVGQTKNRFSTRWTGHRHSWKNNISIGDNAALLNHYYHKHPNHFKPKSFLSDYFTVIFLEQPPIHLLDICESRWINKLNATINIQTTILPKHL